MEGLNSYKGADIILLEQPAPRWLSDSCPQIFDLCGCRKETCTPSRFRSVGHASQRDNGVVGHASQRDNPQRNTHCGKVFDLRRHHKLYYWGIWVVRCKVYNLFSHKASSGKHKKRGADRASVGQRTELAGRKVRANREKGRSFVGERPCLSGSQRAVKTFSATAKNVRSGRREYSQRALRTCSYSVGVFSGNVSRTPYESETGVSFMKLHLTFNSEFTKNFTPYLGCHAGKRDLLT